MTFQQFVASISDTPTPPVDVSPLLASLWHDRKGDWDRAHRIAQDIEGEDAAWVHAYLHRREGDLGNAAYWYRRANRPVCAQDLASEWETIAKSLLGGGPNP